MSDILMFKTPEGRLAPMDDAAREVINKLSVGQGVKIKVTKVRNPKFHRKVFALFKLAYDLWYPEPQTYRGQPVEKEFNRFWKDLIILAGHYTSVINIKGEVRVEAKSISFSSMDDLEFAEVYKSVLNTVWNKVLRYHAGYNTPEDVDRIVEELLRFE